MLSRFCVTLLQIVASMSTSVACTIVHGRPYQYAERKRFWLHDGFIPAPNGDLKVQVLTFSGDPLPLDQGAYSINARPTLDPAQTVDEPPPTPRAPTATATATATLLYQSNKLFSLYSHSGSLYLQQATDAKIVTVDEAINILSNKSDEDKFHPGPRHPAST
ncbi:hypothetical protein BDN67DRAFT_980554 [Paxillus ammoniavirescens]|nr:hypothetical protein BDN67DRAFT_980554 [Paxillus ammoniavirescens]